MNINYNSNEFVWTEKYRPTVIEDCILPVKLREIFNKVIEVGQMQNMIFASGPGTGKCLGPNTEVDLVVSDETYAKLVSMGVI